jgi:hypothetical protein
MVRSRKQSALFDGLVTNGVEFLKRSIAEIERSPKYSVINFCAALEIFLKARLMREHWSLVVSKPDAANIKRFESGDFQSVTMSDSIRRLREVCNEPITEQAEASFKVVSDHRNKLMHFFHPKYSRRADPSVLQQIAAEQCKAWFHLHRLLDEQWSAHFSRQHLQKIKHLSNGMHRVRAFLRAKYDALKPEIATEIKRGAEYEECAACGFSSAEVSEFEQPLCESECKVCRQRRSFLRFSCSECGSMVSIEDPATGKCAKCGIEMDVEYLLEHLGPNEDPKEPEIVYCSSCEYSTDRTAIPFEDGYLCLACLDRHDAADECGRCGEPIAGLIAADTHAFGCFLCHAGWAERD